MKKTIALKGLSFLLVINLLCSFLTACGVDGSGEGQDSMAGDPTGSSIGSSEEQIGVAEDSDNGSDSGETASGEGLPNIMENPAYSAMGRQVLTAVIESPFRGDLDRIIAYNADNPSYFIELRSYGSGAESFKNLDTQLPLDVLSGKGPDLVIWGGINYSPSLASERLMENLNEFMDADPDFHREDYYENILEAFELNGGLYLFPASFSVCTGCVRAEELGTDRGITEGWTLGEMMEAYENSSSAKIFASNFTKEQQLYFMCRDCMDNFVDWNSGECHFDAPEFVELLKWCDTFPEQFQEELEGRPHVEGLRSGEIFWYSVDLSSPISVAIARTKHGDADLLWPGQPAADGEKGSGGVAEPGGLCFSICKNSNNQEAAWEFIKSWLTVDAQRKIPGAPLLRSVSEEEIQKALTLEYEMVGGIRQEKPKYEVTSYIREDIEGETLRVYCATEEDAEIYRSIIENTHRSYGNDPGILDIIMEEAGAYFGSDKDAATVANIIQNRVSMYVSERMK